MPGVSVASGEGAEMAAPQRGQGASDSLEIGMDAYISKPVNASELSAAMEALLVSVASKS